jgi:type IV secretion system protein VirB2
MKPPIKDLSTKDLSIAWQSCLMIMLCAVIAMMPDFALAQITPRNTPMGNVLCSVAGWFTGNTGKGLATIAITVIGIGALLGKVSWGMAIIVGVGVAIVFGAAGIVSAMNAGAGDVNTTCTTGGGAGALPPPGGDFIPPIGAD